MRENDCAIRLERIRKSYGAKIAVDDFDLAVPNATGKRPTVAELVRWVRYG